MVFRHICEVLCQYIFSLVNDCRVGRKPWGERQLKWVEDLKAVRRR